MKDIKIHDLISPVDTQKTGKSGKKPTAGGQAEFSRTLESALSNLNAASSKEAAQAPRVDSSSLKEEVTASNEQFQQMMKAGEDLQKLYWTLTRKSDDRS